MTFINVIGEALQVSNEVYGRRSKKKWAELSEINRLRCYLERTGISWGWAQGYDGYKTSSAAAKAAWGRRDYSSLRRHGTTYSTEFTGWWDWVEKNFPEVITKDIKNPYNENIISDRINIGNLQIKVAERLLEISRGLPEGLF